MQVPTGSSELLAVYDLVTRATVTIALAVFIYGGFKKWVVFGWQLADAEARYEKAERKHESDVATMKADCAEWKAIALGNLRHAEAATDLAHAATKKTSRLS